MRFRKSTSSCNNRFESRVFHDKPGTAEVRDSGVQVQAVKLEGTCELKEKSCVRCSSSVRLQAVPKDIRLPLPLLLLLLLLLD